METAIRKRPRGRPKKEFDTRVTEPFRAIIAAKEIKPFLFEDPNFDIPQHHQVSEKLYEHCQINIAPSQYYNWFKGKNSPSKSTLQKLAKGGIDLRSIFISIDEIHKKGTINHIARHLLTIDLASSKNITRREKRIIARRILDDIDADWTPCDERIFFIQPEGIALSKKWNDAPPQLHPRPKRVDKPYLVNYDPYNMLSLVPWLLSITPFYYSKPLDLERLTMDLISTSLCLLILGQISNSNSFGAPARSYQSHFLTLVFELPLINKQSIICPSIKSMLDHFSLMCRGDTAHTRSRLEKSALKIYQSYDIWLKKYGLSKQELAIAIGLCNSEIAQELELFDY